MSSRAPTSSRSSGRSITKIGFTVQTVFSSGQAQVACPCSRDAAKLFGVLEAELLSMSLAYLHDMNVQIVRFHSGRIEEVPRQSSPTRHSIEFIYEKVPRLLVFCSGFGLISCK